MPSWVSVRTQLRKYSDLSMFTPATLPPRIWERVCGTKTRSRASAYSLRDFLSWGNPWCRPSLARTSSRRLSNLESTNAGKMTGTSALTPDSLSRSYSCFLYVWNETRSFATVLSYRSIFLYAGVSISVVILLQSTSTTTTTLFRSCWIRGLEAIPLSMNSSMSSPETSYAENRRVENGRAQFCCRM